MKTRHECTNLECGYFWIENGPQDTCPECSSTVTSVDIIDFLEPGQGNVSSKRTVCYSFKDGVITGRAPDREIAPGVILTGVPYINLQKKEYVVEYIEYRPHRGEMSNLFHWTARCHEAT